MSTGQTAAHGTGCNSSGRLAHKKLDRRDFVRSAVAGASLAGVHVASSSSGARANTARKRIKVGVIGCGSVSRHYFPDLLKSSNVEIVSACDIRPERAAASARTFGVAHHFPHIDQMLAGPKFDLMVNLTDMQEHYRLNKQAIEAGVHVWSEKPMSTTYTQARELSELADEKGVLVYGAPTVVASPQFAFMAKALQEKRLGRLAAAHASYGHNGPNWSSFFYDKDGGSLFDLGVYQVTSLTGLLGPAKSVVAMTSIVTPTRQIRGKGEVEVEAEDNAMLILDHGEGVLSHVQCGFNYHSADWHDSTARSPHTMTIVGREGKMYLAGYDWAPHGVDMITSKDGRLGRQASDRQDYVWQFGARKMAEHLAGGPKPRFAPEHAMHVVEIMEAVKRSQAEGKRITLASTFDWPVL